MKNLISKQLNLYSKKFIIISFTIFFIQSLIFSYEKIYFTKDQIIFEDGDTFKLSDSDTTLRFLGVDTPEVKGEFFTKDQYLGKEASAFTKKQILNAQKLYYVPTKKDRYDRILAFIFVDDELLPLRIIKAGLGYETMSFYKNKYEGKDAEIFKNWDETMKKATEEIGRPNFQNPFYWRKKNRLPEFTK